MLHRQKKVVYQQEADAPLLNVSIGSEGAIIAMIYGIACELSQNPQVYQMGKNTVWVYFQGSCFSCDALMGAYGTSLAFASQTHPVVFCGDCKGQETVELTGALVKSDKKVLLKRFSDSGRDFDDITNLCLRITVEDAVEATEICELIRGIDCFGFSVAVRRTAYAEKALAGCPQVIPDAYYRYIPMTEPCTPTDCVMQLPIDKQKRLWSLFLEYELSSLEFEYLSKALESGGDFPLFTWELSLRLALNDAGYSISYGENGFEVRRGDSSRVVYDYEEGSAAERMFLKVLFPVPVS